MRPSPAVAAVLGVALGVVALPAAAQTREAWRTDFSRHTVPLVEIVSGGPPKDGIPSLNHPRFVSVPEADTWLAPREPVVLLVEGEVAKGYPLQILIWHEIVNDDIGGRPVAVTFCPLCNTALAFDRRVAGRVLDFGTTGQLRHSDLVMYDRQTESWWQQATGEAIVGEQAGRMLEVVNAPIISWQEFKAEYPTGLVLSRQTGFDRPYGENPYAGYDDPKGSPIASFFRGHRDDRLPPMERVAAVSIGGEDVAYPFSLLQRSKAINDRVGNVPIVVLWVPGTTSALDARRIAAGRDVGSTGVFDRRVGTTVLELEPGAGGRFVDRASGTEFNVLGHAVGGPLRGTTLRPVPHGNHFWFAWAAFKPATRIRGSSAVGRRPKRGGA
jgi:hypothetical protein